MCEFTAFRVPENHTGSVSLVFHRDSMGLGNFFYFTITLPFKSLGEWEKERRKNVGGGREIYRKLYNRKVSQAITTSNSSNGRQVIKRKWWHVECL